MTKVLIVLAMVIGWAAVATALLGSGVYLLTHGHGTAGGFCIAGGIILALCGFNVNIK